MDGRRAHDLARAGQDVTLAARRVRIDAIRCWLTNGRSLDVEVDCGKGTYIRSIARDLGERLGCGGLVQTLRRTRVGPFTAEQGIGLDVTPEAGRGALLSPLTRVARHGRRFNCLRRRTARFRSGQMTEYVGDADVGLGIRRSGA